MPTVVEIPEIGEVEFPDGMSDADVQSASSRLYGEKVGLPPVPSALPVIAPPPGITEEEEKDLAVPGMPTFGRPVARLPRYEKPPELLGGEPTTLAVGGGIYNALAGAAESITTPESAMTLGLAGAPKAIGRLAQGIWAAFMAKNVPEQVNEARKAFKEGKPLSEKVEKTLLPIVTTAFAATGAKEAFKPEPIPFDVSKVEQEAALGGVPIRETVPTIPEAISVKPEPSEVPRIAVPTQPVRQVPEVPETAAEAGRGINVSEEIRKAGARTIAQVQALFPASKLTREQARVFRNAAWGTPEQPTPVPVLPEPTERAIPQATAQDILRTKEPIALEPEKAEQMVGEQTVQQPEPIGERAAPRRASLDDVEAIEAEAEAQAQQSAPKSTTQPTAVPTLDEWLNRRTSTKPTVSLSDLANLLVKQRDEPFHVQPNTIASALRRWAKDLNQAAGISKRRGDVENEAVKRGIAERLNELADDAGANPKTVEAAGPASTETITLDPIGNPTTFYESGSLRAAQARKDPALAKAQQYYGTKNLKAIEKAAKQGFERRQIPPPTKAENMAMLAGSHIAGIPDPIALAFAITFGSKTGRELVGNVARFYSEPLTERLAAEGGSQAKGFANMGNEIAQRAKELYGSLTDVLDPALEAMGKMNRTTTWLNDIAPTTKKWGFRNAQQAVEGPLARVPTQHQAAVQLLKDANLRIGQLAQPVVPGFVATGKYQRSPTAFLVDTIRSGKGPSFDLLKNALSAENRIPASRVRDILLEIKKEFDAPGSQQTVNRIAQEFERHFPKFPTDLKIQTPIGDVWMPILHARPFEYLQHAAMQTAQRVAFLERVPQGTLGQLREGVVAELKSPEAFDDLVRALHGLPVNEPLRLFAPGTLQNMIASGANRVLTDIFGSLKLTASAISNLPETVLGNTPAFFGWKNFIKGAATLKARYAALEKLGAINRAIYNFSYDPKAPVRSVLSDFRQGVRKLTMQQFFNEMQEMLAASTAQVFSEQASGRLLSPREQGLFTETAVGMGFNRRAAKAMAEGLGTQEQYGNFVRRAAAYATGGNIQGAEMSRFGGNRVLTSLFRFQSYPVMKLNAFRKAYINFADAVESKDPRRIKASSEQLAKFLFNTTAQGAAAAFLASLLTGRSGGVKQTLQDAEDNPGKFIFDSTMAGLGGPFTAINYALNDKRTDLLDPKNINSGITFPGSIYLELKQLFNLEGPYEGMTMKQAVEKYSKTRIPAGKMINHALEEAGLVSDAQTSMSTLYRLFDEFQKNHPDEGVRANYERNKNQQLGIAKYRAVRMAIQARDESALEKAVEALESEGTTLQDIRDELNPFTKEGKPQNLFNSSTKLEKEFKDSLDERLSDLYDKAIEDRKDAYEWFKGQF